MPVDSIGSLAPLIDAQVLNLTGEDTPQIYTLCGKGPRSALRVLKHGLEVSEIAVSELPGIPSALWTVRISASDQFDRYIVISFVNATLVLSIGDSVEEVTDTGFLVSTATLSVSELGDDGLVQVYAHGIRHIRQDRRVSEWRTPKGLTILHACCNKRQVAVALSSGEIVYFELDRSDNLNEYQEHKEMGQVASITLSPISEGRQRAQFLAVGCMDNTVRMLSLDPSNCLEELSLQALSATPTALALNEMVDSTSGITSLFLNIGLGNGVLLRTTVDSVTGVLTDSRLRFLGAKPIKLFSVQIAGQAALLALSTSPWLSYSYQSRQRLVPLTYEAIEYGSSFSSEQCQEGMVVISGSTLRIISVDKLGGVFNQSSIKLKYTPRRFVFDEPSKAFVIIEADHNVLCDSELQKRLGQRTDMSDDDYSILDPEVFGTPAAGEGKWASCIRLLDPVSAETHDLIELTNNEAAVSICVGTFSSHPRETLYVVGSSSDRTFNPPRASEGFISIFRITQDKKFELIHKVLFI